MTREQFIAIGLALYGGQWQTPVARALGCDARSIRRVVAGRREVSDRMTRGILRLDAAEEWIFGESPETPAEYIIHARFPRFIARHVTPGAGGDGGDGDMEVQGAVCVLKDGSELRDFVWIDPRPDDDDALNRLARGASSAADMLAVKDHGYDVRAALERLENPDLD